MKREGFEGWDEYAPFYDWENARTLGRRDVPFWRNLALHAGGRVLELGCGTGRILLPLARAGVPLVGIDRSAPMLARARARVRRARVGDRTELVRGDIRFLPFGPVTARGKRHELREHRGEFPDRDTETTETRPLRRASDEEASSLCLGPVPAFHGFLRRENRAGDGKPHGGAGRAERAGTAVPPRSLAGDIKGRSSLDVSAGQRRSTGAAPPRSVASAVARGALADKLASRFAGPAFGWSDAVDKTDEPAFEMVIAPYGILQSLLRERDLTATLAEVQRVLARGGTFGMELVADLPSWQEYRKRISLTGWRGRSGGAHVTLVETVRQDRKRGLTIFDQEFTETRGRVRQVRRFSLTFRTLSVPQMVRRLERAGFEITALLGDYRGGPWDPRADVWVILARKP